MPRNEGAHPFHLGLRQPIPRGQEPPTNLVLRFQKRHLNFEGDKKETTSGEESGQIFKIFSFLKQLKKHAIGKTYVSCLGQIPILHCRTP
jgi:hypothetical protein